MLGHFHAAGTTPVLWMSIPWDLEEQRVVTSYIQAVACFHSMLKIMLFVPVLCVFEPPVAHCCSVRYLLSEPAWRL